MAQQRVLHISCNIDNGDYSVGDEIEVYYNDTTGVIEVEVNDVSKSSGSDIPEAVSQFPLGGGTTGGYDFTVIPDGYQFCDGDYLQTFHFQESFPYAYRDSNFSESCSTVICDIAKGNTILTPATGVDQADGSIFALASSSNGTVKYALFDFNYNTEGQTNPTHSNLFPGVYTVYAKDAAGCSLVWEDLTVTFNPLSSYGVLQDWEYYNKDGTNHKIELLERGYSGSPTNRDLMDETPTRRSIRGENATRLNCIFPGELEVNVKSQTDKEYLELIKNADDKKYLIKFYYNPGGGDQLIFEGFLTVANYSEPYEPGVYTSTLVATDRLGDLSKIDFTDDFGNQIYGDISVFDVIRYCLRKTGLEFGYRVGMNLYEANHDSTSADDPLTQTYVNSDTYYTDGEPDDCYTVLNDVLNSINCEVRSYGGYWYIIYKPEKYTTYNYRQFDKDGNYESNSSVSPQIDFKQSTESTRVTWLTGGKLIDGADVYKNININSLRKLAQSVVNPFEKRTLNGDGFLGWSKVLNGDSGTVEPVINPPKGNVIGGATADVPRDTYYFRLLFSDDQGGDAYIVSSGSIEYKGADSFKIKFTVIYSFGYRMRPFPPYVRLKYMLKVGSKYYNTNGDWSVSEVINNYDLEVINEETEIEINGQFDSTVTSDTETTYELRLYDIDPFESDLQQANILDLINALPSVSGLDEGARRIGRITGTNTVIYFEIVQDSGGKAWNTIGAPARTFPVGSSSVFYGSVELLTFPSGQQIEDTETININTTDGNIIDLEHDLRHFDLNTEINNTENLVINYFKLSDGTPTNSWGASGKKIQRIHGEQISEWYNTMGYRIKGSITTDQHLSPINVFREVSDNNRIYTPVAMDIDDKRMTARLELIEIQSDETVTASAFTSGFEQDAYR